MDNDGRLPSTEVKSLFIEMLWAEGLIGDGEKELGLKSPRVLGLFELFRVLERLYSNEADLRIWANNAIRFYKEIASSAYLKTVTVNVTRHYGNISVELGITQSLYLMSNDATKIQTAVLVEHVHDLHRDYALQHIRGRTADNSGGAVAGGGGGGAVDASPSPKGETMPAEEIVLVKDGKKTFFKLRGGKYSEFGVRIWPEVLKKAGLDVASITDSFAVSGHAIIELSEVGKPVKVLELVLDGNKPV